MEYTQSIREVIAEVDSSENGLSAVEAARRTEAHGKNKLAEPKKKPIIVRFIEELINPMIIILIVAAIISGVTSWYAGESFVDVIIIMAVVVINAILGVVQENKAEKAIAALKEITAATSKVLRDGKVTVVKSEELVPGDIVLLEAGDSVPADGRIIECASLKVEEAALTGESLPVVKTAEAIKADGKVPLGDRKNMVYMGSTVVYGRGKVVITGTGMRTEMGKIADALSQAKDGQTPLQRKLGQLSKVLSFLVIGICAVIFAIDLIRTYPNITINSTLDTFMVAVSLAVAAIPEGLAAVFTIVLSIGVTNMSKRNAVIRKLTAVETLGCTQVICSDKTGTLTQNKMTVVEFSGDKEMICRAMALCCDAELVGDKSEGEPTECALVNFAAKEGFDKNKLKKAYPRVGEAPFDSMRKMMSTVHAYDGRYVQFTKGAPDEVIKRCNSIWLGGKIVELSSTMRREILDENKRMAQKALRVLSCAVRYHSSQPAPDAANLERDMCFVGLTGMIDPVRPEVMAAIDECKKAGIRPVMITGDHLDTAVAIAKQLGIISSADEAITGAALDEISDEQLQDKIEKYSVYARVQPEHKVRIVKAWKKKGMVTAMTGDGVNDAPSIKNADIGIGMGITGTDVTKNVADMVLADDNFATIVAATEEGRRIYDNIRKSIQFLLASNLSEVLSIFVAMVMGFTILQPVHLLWINLITDCFPALALGMESAEEDIMSRPPRNSKDGIFAGGMLMDVIIQGVLVTIITIIAYYVGHNMEFGTWEVANSGVGMTMAFLALSMAEIFHSFNMRSRHKSVFRMKHNRFIWCSTAASFICTTLVIYVPFLSAAFGFAALSLAQYSVAIGLAITIIPIVELIKYFQRQIAAKKKINID
ncbi:MAG: cation-translocating P-type ATPase [Clostridiales bacterium]|nr:cation-translocating P-type ATPase [Clostridiales bacterium]